MVEKVAHGWAVQNAVAGASAGASGPGAPGLGGKVAYPFGASVQQAVAAKLKGRLIVVGEDYWQNDGKSGFPGHDGQGSTSDTTFQADSRRTVQAMVAWLTGKATGATILIMGIKSSSGAPSAINRFGYQFSDGLEANGHTVTWTGDVDGFGAYDPINFDLLCVDNNFGVFTYHGLTTDQARFDYIIDNGTAILSDADNAVTEVYGIRDAAANHATVNVSGHRIHVTTMGPATGTDAPGWRYQRPFYLDSAFGRASTGGSWGTDYWALTMGTTGGVVLDDAAWTKGGTRVLAECALERYGAHSDVDNDGLGVVACWSP